MNTELIGKQIALMRKERGIKQEQLANHVGISTQAVSKWENGGVPDIELLPKIADFFNISIDSLFGRNMADYSDIRTVIEDKIYDAKAESAFKLAFEYCWSIERALIGKVVDIDFIRDESIEEYEKKLDQNAELYSSILTDFGFTRMGIANRLQYFLIVPDCKDKEQAFFNGIDYTALFKDLSDKDIFNACVLFSKREHKKAFTLNLLKKNLGITDDKAEKIINVLAKYYMIDSTQIELDDEIQIVYNFIPSPSFVALLIFAREIIDRPKTFAFNQQKRNKPYLG